MISSVSFHFYSSFGVIGYEGFVENEGFVEHSLRNTIVIALVPGSGLKVEVIAVNIAKLW